MATKKTPGELMREARDARGKTQTEIAEELGVSQVMVSKWEADQARPRKVRTVAKVYGLKPEQLLPDESAA